jgi:hypothetical protein
VADIIPSSSATWLGSPLQMNKSLPSGYVKIAIKHGPFNHLEIVDLPIKDCDLTLRKL